MEACKVVAEVMIETASHPATPWYLCSYSGANPLVCTTSASYSALLRDPAFKELNKVAAEKGCTVAVQVGEKVCRIVIVEGAETVRDLDRALEHGKQTYRALNTANGIVWLMRYLSLR
jgi:hypothetical protein